MAAIYRAGKLVQRGGKVMGRVKAGAVAFVLLLAFVIVWLSWYTVPEGFRGVITRNNAVVGIAEPGLGFKVPFIDSVTDMSVQTERSDFSDISSYSKDIQQSISAVTVNYRLLPDAVERVYAEVGTDFANRLLAGRLAKHFKEAFGKHAAAEIVNQRDVVSDEIETAFREDMQPFGVLIEDVQIVNVDFSDAYEQAVEASATAEARVKQARQELEKIKVDAQQKVAQAQAEADARRLAADAEAYQIKAKGDAEAEAIRARALALQENPSLVALITAEKWNGVLPTTMVPGGTLPFLELSPAGAAVAAAPQPPGVGAGPSTVSGSGDGAGPPKSVGISK
jgi:regulator of protease activity HflC (stomatin/prohibitin superfamily)